MADIQTAEPAASRAPPRRRSWQAAHARRSSVRPGAIPAPTVEQQAAIALFGQGDSLKVNALAGSGKTTTMRMLAASRPKPGLYLAFNHSVAVEAKASFPGHVDCRTNHSLAYRSVARDFACSDKLTGRMLSNQLADQLGLRERSFSTSVALTAVQQAHLAAATVQRFCQGAATELETIHVPVRGRLLGLDGSDLAHVRHWTMQQARQLWDRMNDPRDPIPLGHDGYLKRWALAGPRLSADYILLDEAQDANGVILGILAAQTAQIVYVGDRHQQIYAWRGAVNAMDMIGGGAEAALTQSFRFGDPIAEAASKVLMPLGETRTLRGDPAHESQIVWEGDAQAILTRTNGGLVREVLKVLDQGRSAAIVGGPGALMHLLRDVFALKEKRPAASPELFGFQSWEDVVAFAETDEGEELATLVRLVEQHGELKLWAVLKRVEASEARADIVLSTAHKAKGREWESVRLAGDFGGSRAADPVEGAAERRLFYVAMTRARDTLVVDPEILGRFTAPKAAPPEREALGG